MSEGTTTGSDGRVTGTGFHRRPIRVDFIGTPGVGKSTLCRAVLELMRKDAWEGRLADKGAHCSVLKWCSSTEACRLAHIDRTHGRGWRGSRVAPWRQIKYLASSLRACVGRGLLKSLWPQALAADKGEGFRKAIAMNPGYCKILFGEYALRFGHDPDRCLKKAARIIESPTCQSPLRHSARKIREWAEKGQGAQND